MVAHLGIVQATREMGQPALSSTRDRARRAWAQGDASSSPGVSPEPAPALASPARIRWAVLLARIYHVLPRVCPGRTARGRGGVELIAQTPDFDRAEPDPAPEFDFDPSVPDNFEP